MTTAGFQQQEPKKLGSEISVAGSSYFDKWYLRPYNPSDLYQQRGDYSIYDDMREDDQISAVLSLKKYIVLNSEWDIQSEDDDVKEFIEYCLKVCIDDLLEKKLFQILSALDYGFSISEKVWNIADTPWGKKFVLEKLKTRPPHTFELHTDDKGNLTEIIQYTDNKNNIKLDPRKFITYTYNKEFDNPYGTSELNKGVYRAWASKNAIIKFWNIYLERFGMPTVVGKMPRSGGAGEKNQLLQILKNISSKTAVTVPSDWEIDALEVAKGAGEYEKAINKYDTMIARAMLIPDLMGFSGGETGGGSYALGTNQFDIFYGIIEYIRNDIERLVNREIIAPLVLWNFGSKHEAKFKFNPVDESLRAENMKVWLDAIKSGKVPINGEQINWFLKQVEAPEFDQSELDKIEEDKQAMRDNLANAGNEDGQEDKEDGEKVAHDDVDDDEEGGQEEPKKNTKEYAKYYREFTQYEKKVNFVQIENDLTSVYDEYEEDLKTAFKIVINGLIDDIRKKNIIQNRKIEAIGKIKLRNMAKVKRILGMIMKDSFSNGDKSVNSQKYGVASSLTEKEAAALLEEKLFWITGIEEEAILNSSKSVLLSSIKNGSSITESIKKLELQLAGYIDNAPRVETIIRTNISDAFNSARAGAFNSISEEIQAYQYSSIMDGRTSDICIALDGKIFKTYELDQYNPPNHFNCRSVIVPVFIDEDFEGFTDENAPPKTEEDKNGFLVLE